MFTRSKNWYDYYKRVVDENPFLLSTKTLNTFIEISKSIETNSPIDQRFDRLTNDNRDSILLYAAKGTGKVYLLHSIDRIGGWNASKERESKLVALDGFKTNRANPVIIDKGCLNEVLKVDAPLATRLRNVASTDDLKKVEPPQNNGTTFESRPYILLHPCLWETAMNVRDKSAENMFLDLKTRCEELENENKEENELVNAISNYKLHLLTFLWAFVKNPDEMPSLTFHLTGEDDIHFQRYAHDRHMICIEGVSGKEELPVVRNLEDQFSKSDIIEALGKIASGSAYASNQPSKSSKFEKLTDNVKQLIYNASTDPESEETLEEVTEQCKKFFNSPNVASATCYFDHEMKTTLRSNMHQVATDCLTNIYNGFFFWENEDTPSCFTIFNFEKKAPISFRDANSSETSIKLLKVKQDTTGELSQDDYKSLIKKGTTCPKTVEELKFRIDIASKISLFFFSKDSVLVSSLSTVYQDICDHQLTFENLAKDDEWFVTKFIFAIDNRIQIWFAQCSQCEQRCLVDDSVIDFDEITNSVKYRQFNYTLPKVFVHFIEPNKKGASETLSHGSNGTKKINWEDEKSSKIKPSEVNEDWLVKRVVYNKFMKSPKYSANVPKLENGKRMCCKWLSNGYCFSDCGRADAHVNISDMSKQEKDAYSNYINGIKKKAQA